LASEQLVVERSRFSTAVKMRPSQKGGRPRYFLLRAGAAVGTTSVRGQGQGKKADVPSIQESWAIKKRINQQHHGGGEEGFLSCNEGGKNGNIVRGGKENSEEKKRKGKNNAFLHSEGG